MSKYTETPAIHERKGHTPGELKACPNPWCRSNIKPMPFARQLGGFQVICGCDFHGPRAVTRAEAITAWNTRPIDAELLEALKEWAAYDRAAASNDHAVAAIYYDRAISITRAAITKAEG